MEDAEFKKSAQFIVSRNVSERVSRVLADFKAKEGNLSLIYCVEGEPTEEDVEDCEIACAELIAEFPQIRRAETKCLSSEECHLLSARDEVFSR